MSNKAMDVVLKKVFDALENGVIPWHKPWKSSSMLAQNLISQREYTGINGFILNTVSPYSSPYWATIKQIGQLGGRVNKGEKSTAVAFWKSTQKDIQNVDTQETEKRTFLLARYYNIFNTEQCQLPASLLEKIQTRIEKARGETYTHIPIEACEKIVEGYANKPVIEHGGDMAYFRHDTDTVRMPERSSFPQLSEYYSTLFHELTHSTGHSSRLARRQEGELRRFGDCDYSKEEMIAELGASALCGHAGIENTTINNSAAYIRNWLKVLKDDTSLLVSSASKAEKAYNYILGLQEEKKEELEQAA